MIYRLSLLIVAFLMLATEADHAQSARESTHIIQPGETLAVIAAQYGVELDELAAVNGIVNAHRIRSWQELSIPLEQRADAAPGASGQTHVVRAGEMLNSIAQRYGVDLDALKSVNDLRSHVIHPGDVLQLPGPTPAEMPAPTIAQPAEIAEPEPPAPTLRIVRWGDTLGEIAAAHGLSLRELMRLNDLVSTIIVPGMELKLPGNSGVEPSPAAPNPPRIHADRNAVYTVRAGDSLSVIAAEAGLTLAALMRANDIYYPHRILVGQQLRMPGLSQVLWNVAEIEPPPRTQPTAADPAESQPESADEPDPEPWQPPADHFPHVVLAGESLGALAKHYGVSMEELLIANNIADANRIDQGQQVWIPPTASTRVAPPPPVLPTQAPQMSSSPASDVGGSSSGGAEFRPSNLQRSQYTVQRGDFLGQIGEKLAIDWRLIALVNNLTNPNQLNAGMVLLVPNAEDVVSFNLSQAGLSRHDLVARQPGARIGQGREIVVVLSTQTVYAYENGILQKTALVSTGLAKTPTVQGDFEIYLKRRKQRMTGPGYALDNVEWVMYFHQGYAIHGTWWHNDFGQRRSKGCVNMTNYDAQWFYEFASLGTPVHVRN